MPQSDGDKKSNEIKIPDDNTLKQEILTLLFPLKRMWIANQAINTKIKKLESEEIGLSYMSAYYKLSLKDAKEYLDKTFERGCLANRVNGNNLHN